MSASSKPMSAQDGDQEDSEYEFVGVATQNKSLDQEFDAKLLEKDDFVIIPDTDKPKKTYARIAEAFAIKQAAWDAQKPKVNPSRLREEDSFISVEKPIIPAKIVSSSEDFQEQKRRRKLRGEYVMTSSVEPVKPTMLGTRFNSFNPYDLIADVEQTAEILAKNPLRKAR